MTTADPPAPGTVRELLFGRGTDTPEAIARRLAAEQKLDHALKSFRKVTREIVVHEIADTLAALLDANLAGILVEGWRRHGELRAAARYTLAVPGSSQLVELADHQITEEQQPSINLLVDDHRVATFTFDATLVFDVHALIAGVKAGRLVAVHAGHCDITGTLAIEDTEVLSRKVRVPLRGVLSLTHSIRLLPAAEYPVPTASGRTPASPAA